VGQLSMGWLLLLSGNGVAIAAAALIPRSEFVLRTWVVAMTAILSLGGYLLMRHRENPISAELTTSLGVMAQFLVPPLYFVSVRLSGFVGEITNPYLSYMPDAVVAALLGQTLFLMGYKVSTGRSTVRAIGGHETAPGDYLATMAPLLLLVWLSRVVLLKAGSYYHTVRTPFMSESQYHSVLSIFSGWGIFPVAGAWAMRFAAPTGTQRRAWTPVCLLLTAAEVLWFAPTGSREPLYFPFAAAVFAFLAMRRRWPTNTLALLLVAGFVSLPVIALFRNVMMTYVAPSELSPSLIQQAAVKSGSILRGSSFIWEDHITSAFGRLGDVRSTAVIIKGVPDTVPFLRGETYAKIVYLFLPRFVYPAKPLMILPINRWFFKNDRSSSPTTLTGEAYLNFGWAGLFLVLPVVGAITSRFERFLFRRRAFSVRAAVVVGMAPILARLPVENAVTWVTQMFYVTFVALFLDLWESAVARNRCLSEERLAPVDPRNPGPRALVSRGGR